MSLMPQYDKNNDRAGSIDPRTKALWMITVIILSFLSDNILEMIVILLLIPISSAILNQNISSYKNVIPILLVIASQLILLQILFCRQGDIVYSWWFIDIYDGAFPLAAMGILRASTVVLACMQFLSLISPIDMQLLLMKFKIPYKYATLAAMGFRFMPIIEDEFDAILESQRARGIKMESAWDKIRSLPSVSLPLMYRSMRWSRDAALSMELRGFGKYDDHTFMKDLNLKSLDIISSTIMMLSILIKIII